jgi:Heparinase II/III-like protein/Heparinase II/III N-terminus
MNLNVWKYRYRRLRSLTPDDFTRRLEIRSWRGKILDFVDSHSGPITSASINAWWDHCGSSIHVANPEIGDPGLIASLPEGFLKDSDFWKTFRKSYPGETDHLLSLAEDTVGGKIQLFGWKKVPVSVPTLEPQNTEALEVVKSWDLTNYWDINFFHSKARPDFDVKWLWELQRLQFLLWLGAAWRLTGDNRFASVAREILDWWFNHLKYPLGVEWSSNLEVGLRLLSISRCHIMFMNSPTWDSKFISTLAAWNRVHATHLREEITLHYTLGNHQLGEASALVLFALIYPTYEESSSWKAFGSKTIEKILPDLILSDGVYAEQSTSYLKFVLEFLLPIISASGDASQCLSDVVTGRLKSSLEFIMALSDRGKTTLMIGDSDSGSAIGWGLENYWDFSWLLAAGSTLLNTASLAEGIEKYPAEAFLNTGLEGLEKFNSFRTAQSGRSVATKARTSNYSGFPVGGYHCSRDSYFQMVFDSGPLGMYPGFGHGHADALSVWLNIGNKPIIVDSGTMRYNAQFDVRSFFRQTSSHNTLVINRSGQAEVLDTFKWASNYRVDWSDAIEMANFRVFSGLLFTNSYIHKRIILHSFEKGFIICDRVSVHGDASVESYFHLHPDVCVDCRDRNKFLISDENELFEVILPRIEGTSCQVVRGSKDPMQGWYSESYGLVAPSYSLKFSINISNTCELVTIIQRPGISLGQAEGLQLLRIM